VATSELTWQIKCDQETFEGSRKDEKFAYIVALGRSANALNSMHSFMLLAGEEDTPAASRNRMNSYLFASALLYEILKLIRRMNQTFQDDEVFQNGLRLILKDPTAKQIEKAHLNPVRHGAVFHFDPEIFAETIAKSTCEECLFVHGRGMRKGDVNYAFADVIAAEILVGFAEDSEEFYAALEDAMKNTRNLVLTFIPAAEALIAHHLKRWGFYKTTIQT